MFYAASSAPPAPFAGPGQFAPPGPQRGTLGQTAPPGFSALPLRSDAAAARTQPEPPKPNNELDILRSRLAKFNLQAVVYCSVDYDALEISHLAMRSYRSHGKNSNIAQAIGRMLPTEAEFAKIKGCFAWCWYRLTGDDEPAGLDRDLAQIFLRGAAPFDPTRSSLSVEPNQMSALAEALRDEFGVFLPLFDPMSILAAKFIANLLVGKTSFSDSLMEDFLRVGVEFACAFVRETIPCEGVPSAVPLYILGDVIEGGATTVWVSNHPASVIIPCHAAIALFGFSLRYMPAVWRSWFAKRILAIAPMWNSKFSFAAAFSIDAQFDSGATTVNKLLTARHHALRRPSPRNIPMQNGSGASIFAEAAARQERSFPAMHKGIEQGLKYDLIKNALKD